MSQGMKTEKTDFKCDNFDYTIWRREYFDKMDLDLYRWDIIPGAITEARVSAYITGTAKR